MNEPTQDESLSNARNVADRLRARLEAAVLGRSEVIDLLLIALFADGHVLLEDYPGSGKTSLAKALGIAIEGTTPDQPAEAPQAEEQVHRYIEPFRRIQFTPDLLPSDITGTSIFDLENQRFSFRPGPVFAHVVVADEINRTSPKVQAAMLEAMAEKQVTVDNETHPLDELFFVIATQNPLDLAGTYPLPTPQLDRFLFKVRMEHIARDAEIEVLNNYPSTSLERPEALPKVHRDAIVAARRSIRDKVAIHPLIREAVVDFAKASRTDSRILQGASTRSLLLLLPALQTRALLQDRDHVLPEDLDALAPYVFTHRMEFATSASQPSEVLRACLAPSLEQLSKQSLRG